jgi:hypothetical protein
VTKRRFFEICDDPELFEKEFAELQVICLEYLNVTLTSENWEQVYKLYKAALDYTRAERRIDITDKRTDFKRFE